MSLHGNVLHEHVPSMVCYALLVGGRSCLTGAVCHISARFNLDVITNQVHSGTVFSVKQTILTLF